MAIKTKSSCFLRTAKAEKRKTFKTKHQQERKMGEGLSKRVLTFLILISLVAVAMNLLSTVEAQDKKKPRRDVPLVKGLSWSFYQKACPKVESIIRKELKKVFKRDIGLAAAILRIHFHDCFVQVSYLFPSFLFFVFVLRNMNWMFANPNLNGLTQVL